MAPPRLILASESPRRQQLLRDAGYAFDIQPADIDESIHPDKLLPADLAEYLADRKASAVVNAPGGGAGDVILAADTIVAFGDQPLGKPMDEAHARQMLDLLSGTTHIVVTAVRLAQRGIPVRRGVRVLSAVRMRVLTSGEIENYVAGGQWRGKAGGYGIQDPDPFVTRIAGCQTNIVGLPMSHTRELLAQLGIHPGQQPVA